MSGPDRAKQKIASIANSLLDVHLTGFWANDVWPVSEFSDFPSTAKGIVDFQPLPPKVRAELKYACWLKFSGGSWTMSNSRLAMRSRMSDLRMLVARLQRFPEPLESLMDYSREEWDEFITRDYNSRLETSKDNDSLSVSTSGTRGARRPPHSVVSPFHSIYDTVKDAYLDAKQSSRYDEDIWELPWDMKTSPQSRVRSLNFNVLQQPWLREAAKKFIKYRLNTVSGGSCAFSLIVLREFSRFLASKLPTLKPEDINRQAIVQYLKWLDNKSLSPRALINHIGALSVFIERCVREGWVLFPPSCRFQEDDRPRATRPEPQPIPPKVLRQLFANADGLPLMYWRMLQIISQVGMRIGELCTLPLDCLRPDSGGTPYLQFYQSKMSRERGVPITSKVESIIRDQIRETSDALGSSAIWLFPSTSKIPKRRSMPVGMSQFIDAMNELAKERRVLGENGAIYHFKSHQFRHTLISDMVAREVPLAVIQKYIDHDSPDMTMRYVDMRDSKMREKYDATRSGQGIQDIDRAGRVVTDIPAEADSAWLKKNILSQALPNGRCGLPTIGLQRCPHANACLTCDLFRTNSSFIDVHEKQLEETRKILDIARANGWQRQIEVNEEVEKNLCIIIEALEVASLKEGSAEISLTERSSIETVEGDQHEK